MGEIVNLRKARKNKARTDKADRAAANRLTHGRTRTEKKHLEAEKAREKRDMDGKILK